MSYTREIDSGHTEVFAKHASLESITIYQKRAYEAAHQADAEYEWLCDLYEERLHQIKSGAWPVGVDTEKTPQ